MPYQDPNVVHNPATGTIAPASWGDTIRDQLQYLSGGFPHCSVYGSAAQSLTNNTTTNLLANSENSDIGGLHSTSTNTDRATVPAGEGGLYRVSAVISYAANATGYRVLNFRVNNTTDYNVTVLDTNATASLATTMSGSRSMVLAAGDYVVVQAYQNSGGALNCTLLDFTVEWRSTS